MGHTKFYNCHASKNKQVKKIITNAFLLLKHALTKRIKITTFDIFDDFLILASFAMEPN